MSGRPLRRGNFPWGTSVRASGCCPRSGSLTVLSKKSCSHSSRRRPVAQMVPCNCCHWDRVFNKTQNFQFSSVKCPYFLFFNIPEIIGTLHAHLIRVLHLLNRQLCSGFTLIPAIGNLASSGKSW